MFTPSIKSQVMGLVKARIKEAQKYHDEQLKIMKTRHDQEKAGLLTQVVSSVINSFTK